MHVITHKLIDAVKNQSLTEARDLISQQYFLEQQLYGKSSETCIAAENEHWFDDFGYSALFYAVKYYNPQIFNIFINYKNHYFLGHNAYKFYPLDNSDFHYDIPILFCVLHWRRDELAVKLLSLGVNPAITYSNGKSLTLAHYAARNNNEVLLKLAIQKQSHFNYIDIKSSITAIPSAILRRNERHFDLLLAADTKCLDDNIISGQKILPLHASISSWNINITKKLLAAGCPINSIEVSNRRYTALHIAGLIGNVAALELLLASGAKIQVATITETALYSAMDGGQPEAVEFLLSKGCQPFTHDDQNMVDLYNVYATWLKFQANYYTRIYSRQIPLEELEDGTKARRLTEILHAILRKADPFTLCNGISLYSASFAFMADDPLINFNGRLVQTPENRLVLFGYYSAITKMHEAIINHTNDKLLIFSMCEKRMRNTGQIKATLPSHIKQYIRGFLLDKNLQNSSKKIRQERAAMLFY